MTSFARFENNRLVVGNKRIERAVRFVGAMPISEYILDKRTGRRYEGIGEAMFNLAGFDFTTASLAFDQAVTDNAGQSEAHLTASVTYETPAMRVVQQFEIYDDSPFITTNLIVSGTASADASAERAAAMETGIEQDAPAALPAGFKLPPVDTLDSFGMDMPHVKAERITLVDRTDRNDWYIRRESETLYNHAENALDGSLFLLDDYTRASALLVVKEAPCPASQLLREPAAKDLFLRCRRGGYIRVAGSGIGEVCAEPVYAYGVTVGIGSRDALLSLYKRHYSKVFLGSGRLFAMSNTWGDRSRDAALCEEFMLRERACAERIGVDIMQLDDGWQKGLSANSAQKAGQVWSSGFYREDPHFWDVHPEKFPSGLAPIMSDTVELALWFSADGDDDYANFRRDAERLAALSKAYGVRQFKLDGTILKTKLGEARLREFLRLTRELAGGDVTFNLDITSGVRLGYLPDKHIGTLFVENRYTDFANYYPHATLKNLWMLSEIFPARKFQFELLNNRRNADQYAAKAGDDPFAPENYPIEWLFASVMVSNPLFWMEMQHLDDDQIDALAQIVKIWRGERDGLYRADVRPIGELPDGIAYTGFDAVGEDGGWLVLLRESAKEDAYTFRFDGASRAKVLAASDGFGFTLRGGEIDVTFEKQRSYAFLRYYK